MKFRQGILLSLFWFFFFAGQGIFFSYYSLYLRENAGLGGTQIGAVWAMLPLIGVFAYPFWGQVADRTGARARVLAAVTALAALAYFTLTLARGFTGLLAGTAVLALFLTSIVPLGTSVSMAVLGEAAEARFGWVRVWGTVGYLLLVVSFPRALHRMQGALGLGAAAGGPPEPALEVMFLATGVLVLVAAVVAAFLPRAGSIAVRAARGDWRRLMRDSPFTRALVFGFVAFFFLQGPMVLFPVYVRAHGGDMVVVGRMWVYMLMVEIPLVALSGSGAGRFGTRGLLAFGVLAGGVRWVLCAWLDDLALLYPVQMLHGAVVAGLMIGGPLYVEGLVPAGLRSTGQTLWAMFGIGIGGGLSHVTAGWLLEHYGADAPYLAGGLGAIALGCLTPLMLAAPRRPRWGTGS